MSLNWLSLTSSNRPIPFQDEVFRLNIPRVVCTLSGFSSATGTLYLSNQRICFVQEIREGETMHSAVRTVSVPLKRFVNATLVQPYFAPNYYTGQIVPVRGGGLEMPDDPDVKAKFTFNEGGVERFHQEYEKARAEMGQTESLPAYEAAAASTIAHAQVEYLVSTGTGSLETEGPPSYQVT